MEWRDYPRLIPGGSLEPCEYEYELKLLLSIVESRFICLGTMQSTHHMHPARNMLVIKAQSDLSE